MAPVRPFEPAFTSTMRYSKELSVRNRGPGLARLDSLSGLRNRTLARLDFLSGLRNWGPFILRRLGLVHVSSAGRSVVSVQRNIFQ